MSDRRLGPFLLERELGAGGMGAVWLATVEEETAGLAVGAKVALKVLHRHLLSRPGFFKRFLREAELGRRVRHPNVVATFDAEGTESGGAAELFLVMEYVEGRTLRALLKDLGVVPEALVREIGRQIADGLAAVHGAGIVHRDLKPENVLITEDHKVRVMDLGVARAVDASVDLTRTGEFVGSLLYAAPEQLRRAEIGPAADLYALGLVLYELATGTNPFARADVQQVIAAHLTEAPPRADEHDAGVSPFLAELLACLLAKAPGERPPSAAFVRDVLEQGERSAWWADRESTVLEVISDHVAIPVRRATALYGRDRELDALRGAWSRACEGRGGVVWVEGEPGIGKTRLLDAFATELRGAGAHVLYGAYLPASGFGALSDAILRCFGAARLEETLAPHLAATPRLIPAYAAFLRQEGSPPGSEPLSPQALHAATCHLVRGLAREKPLLWVVDDLHHAEPVSRQVVLSMARAAAGERALLVVTSRPGAAGDDVSQMSRLPGFARIELPRLSPREVMLILRDALKSRTVAERLGGPIAYKSDGVPYFILEMLEEMKDSQVLRRLPDGSYETTRDVRQIEVPSAVRDLVRARLAELSEDERAILDAAAVQGFEFDADVIARVREMKRVVVLERLASVERRLGLVRGRGGKCRFDQHQVQEVIYDEMMEELRDEYHALVGDVVLARDAPRGGEASYLVAYHHLRGNRPEACRPHLQAALSHLDEMYRHLAAWDMADRALAKEGLLDDESREVVLLRKAAVLDRLGRRTEQRAALDQACASAETSRHPARRARAQRALARHLVQAAGMDEARRAAEEAVALARESGDVAEEVAAAGALGGVYLECSRWADARAQFERQSELARAAGLRRDERDARGNLGVVLKRLGRPEESLAAYEEGIAVSREIGDRRSEAFTNANLGALLKDLGRHDEARARFESALTVFREIGDRPSEAAVTANLGNLQKSLGRWADALESHETHLALSRETGSRQGEAVALVNLGPLLAGLGDADAARAKLLACRTIASEIGARRVESYAVFELGVVAEHAGDLAVARALHEEALSIREQIGYPLGVAAGRLALGRVLAASGDGPAAVTSFDRAIETARALDAADIVATAVCHRCAVSRSGAETVAEVFAAYGTRLRMDASVEARHAAWRATGGPAHLAEARRVLRLLLDHAPERYRDSMARRVPLHRAVLAGSG